MKAREAMNLSAWDRLLRGSAADAWRQRWCRRRSRVQMPPVQYRMIHWNARITDADVKDFGRWAHRAQGAEAGSRDCRRRRSGAGQGAF